MQKFKELVDFIFPFSGGNIEFYDTYNWRRQFTKIKSPRKEGRNDRRAKNK